MKYLLEETIYSLFKCLYLEDSENKWNKLEEENIYQFKYKQINNITSYSFAVSPQKLNEKLTKVFESQGHLIHLNSLKNAKIVYLLKILFQKILAPETSLEYAQSFFTFIVTISNSKNNTFPSSLFNILFLSSIKRSYMLNNYSFYKDEKEILLEKIDLWCKSIEKLDYSKKIPEDYILYNEQKMACASFLHYLTIASKYTDKMSEYKKLFNLEMGKCVNEIDLEFFDSPVRLRVIKLKNIPIEIFKENIGINALEEFSYSLKDGSKFKKTLNEIVSEIKINELKEV